MKLHGKVLIHFSLLLIILVYPSKLFAQFSNVLSNKQVLQFQNYTQNNGLSINIIYKIIADKNNFLWIATQDGVNRFDGYSFKIFRTLKNNQQSLSWNNVWDIVEDPQTGFLWFGTSKKGISVYKPLADSFYNINTNGEKFSFPDPWVMQMKIIGKNFWIATDSGLAVIDRASMKIIDTLNTHDPIRRMAEENDHVVFFMESGDTWLVNKITRRLLIKKSAKEIYGFPSSEISVIDVFHKSARENYVSTTKGLFKIQYAAKELAKAETINLNVNGVTYRNNKVSSFMTDSRNNEWIGLAGTGLLYREKGKAGYKLYSHDAANPSSISDNDIRSMLEDKFGNIWLATEKGLNRVITYPPWLESYNSTSGPSASFLNRLFAIMSTEDSKIFLAQKDNAFVLNASTGFVNNVKNITGLKPDRFYFFYPFHNSIYLAGSKAGITAVTKKKNQYFLERASSNPELDSFKNFNVTSISPVRDDDYLLGMLSKGCWYWNAAAHKVIQLNAEELGSEYSVNNILKDKNRYWIGTTKGLFYWYSGDNQLKHYSLESNQLSTQPSINRIALNNNNLWMTFSNEGVGLLNKQTNKLQLYTVANGLLNNNTYSITESGLALTVEFL